jgi:MerR family transcriptional regulator, thiopeptide resistance regulator
MSLGLLCSPWKCRSSASNEPAAVFRPNTKDDWIKIKAAADGIFAELAKLFKRGHSAHSPEAMDLAERHRKHIARWFYPCSHSFHRGLGELYVNDSHFSAYFERYAKGLTSYARDACVSIAERHQ